jgi:enoyl-CoA hydratase
MEKMSMRTEGGIAVIQMDDGKANAMTPAFFSELNQRLDQAEISTVKLVSFVGRKGFFSGGLDLKLLPNLNAKELNDLAKSFARTLLRVYLFPIPTVAVCTGHAIAGGAMLVLACDRRFAVEGPYRFQVNEVAIGVPLPSWMALLGSSGIPPRWQTEALLHARVYQLSEAVNKGIFEKLLAEDSDIISYIKESSNDIMKLNLAAYSLSKKRMRESKVKAVLQLLANELPAVESQSADQVEKCK